MPPNTSSFYDYILRQEIRNNPLIRGWNGARRERHDQARLRNEIARFEEDIRQIISEQVRREEALRTRHQQARERQREREIQEERERQRRQNEEIRRQRLLEQQRRAQQLLDQQRSILLAAHAQIADLLAIADARERFEAQAEEQRGFFSRLKFNINDTLRRYVLYLAENLPFTLAILVVDLILFLAIIFFGVKVTVQLPFFFIVTMLSVLLVANLSAMDVESHRNLSFRGFLYDSAHYIHSGLLVTALVFSFVNYGWAWYIYEVLKSTVNWFKDVVLKT